MAVKSRVYPKAYIGRMLPLDAGIVTSQEAGTAWLKAALTRIYGPNSPRARGASALYQRLLAADTIRERQACVRDFASTEPATWTLFHANNAAGWYQPTLSQRMQLFQETACAVAARAFATTEPPPAHLVQVSCTGYEAPTAAQRLVAERGWGEATRTLNLGHMGCFAAIPASSLAATLAAQPEAEGRPASVLHIELCSLHVDLSATAPEQIVVQHLFGDGAIRYDLQAKPMPGASFAVVDSFEVLLPDSAAAMTWVLTSDGFRMTLARDVPRLVAASLPGLVSGLLSRNGLFSADIACWAIHPGGTKIIEGVAACLELSEPQLVAHSVAVLRARGNMSSATLPHVWHAMLQDPAVPDGAHVVSLAFGPGLTVTGNLLRKHLSPA